MDWYHQVMDSRRNPLRHLPKAQRFQVMVLLSFMWSAIFSTSAGLWFWYGEIVAVHLLLALGTVVTGLTFRGAEAAGVKSYRDHPAPDGATRYDDVWGA
ncbi:MAG: hypothetical protein AAF495_05050 [Pseudomonadota bacterium]